MPKTSADRDTRSRLVEGAAGLFRRRGYAATGIKAILTETGTPYGSLYHHFPGGKEQLGVAAIADGGETYRRLVEVSFGPDDDLVEATRRFFDGAAALLEATDFEDACPIATVAMEVASTNEPIRRAAAAAFTSWLEVFERRLVAEDVPPAVARDLAVDLFCAIEGGFLLARTTRSADPLRSVGRSVAGVLERALGTAGAPI